jgi:autotransporter-associated beta strand protein
MKRLFLLMLLIPLFSGFEINKFARPVRPMKVHFVSYPNNNVPPVQCMPLQYGDQKAFSMGWLAGNATHLGKVNKDLSPFWVNSCNFGPGMYELTWAINGQLTGANGDAYFYTGQLIIDGMASTLTGTIHINGGTGKFKEATGELELDGTVDLSVNTSTFSGDGWISY